MQNFNLDEMDALCNQCITIKLPQLELYLPCNPFKANS